MKKQNVLSVTFGFCIGVINGLLGAGGGMIAVPLLKQVGFEQKQAHINAVAIILPITALSVILYWRQGILPFSEAVGYIPTGLLGALLGTWLMKKISAEWLKKLFGALMVYAGVRLLAS